MALKYYKNAQRYAQEIPLPGSRSLKLASGYYVFGDFAALSTLSDEGASEPAEVTANPSLLVFEADVSLTDLPTVSGEDGKVLMTDGTGVIWGTPADITGGVDGAGLTDAVAYWSDENTLAPLTGITADAGVVESITLGANQAVTITSDDTDTVRIVNGSDNLINIEVENINTAGITLENPQTPPASASATGTAGQIVFGSDGYLYFCTATDTWVRVQLTTWV